jgi:hypothetical protein
LSPTPSLDAVRAAPADRWPALCVEAAVIVGLFFFYLTCFDRSSAVNGPFEIFGQDSIYIFDALKKRKPYPWNPQSHILYHTVVDAGHRAWQHVFGRGFTETYAYLKLFTAFTGLGFLVGLSWLFRELGLAARQRAVLLALAGVTVSAWFHFSAFETHGLAMPALAVYLVALARLRDRPARAPVDRLLLIGSLAVCGWTRIDLFRFAAVSALLPLLPALRRWRTSLALDLGLAAALVVAGNVGLTRAYLRQPLEEAAAIVLHRDERQELAERMGRIANLDLQGLGAVGRAVSLYSVLMPVEARPPHRGFLAPPWYELDLELPKRGLRPSTGLFLEPARNLFGTAVSLLALAGVAAVLAWAGALSLRRVVAGDPFHGMLACQAACGWLLYAWYDPFEPFLWVLEFLPLWMAMIADHSRGRRGAHWLALGLVALGVGVHNAFAFYLPFR